MRLIGFARQFFGPCCTFPISPLLELRSIFWNFFHVSTNHGLTRLSRHAYTVSMKKIPVNFRLRPDLVARMRKASRAKPIAHSQTAIIELGIVLALQKIRQDAASQK